MVDIIKCYQKSVKENHSIYKNTWYDKNGNKLNWYKEEFIESVNIMTIYEAWLKNDNSKLYANKWSYKLKSLIRTWFTNNVGILVIKGKLITIPVIETIE